MQKTCIAFAVGILLFAASALSPALARARHQHHNRSSIIASYYGYETRGHTASGEIFRPLGLTAASRTLPFGTRLRVSYHGKSVIVRVTDRGPFIRGRALDLSLGAARRIGLVARGFGRVTMEVL